VAGRIDERKDDTAKILAATPPVEDESLVWPPPVLAGTVVWFVNEPGRNSEICRGALLDELLASGNEESRDSPESIGKFDVPLTIDVPSFQTEWDIGELSVTQRDVPLYAPSARGEISSTFAAAGASRTTVESAAPAFREHDEVFAETAAEDWARSHYRPWMAAAIVGIAIVLGGSRARYERRAGLQSIAIADSVNQTDRSPNKGVIIRPDGPPLATIVRPPESITIAPPVRLTGDKILTASRPAEMLVAPPQPDRTYEAAVSASLPQSVGTIANRPAVPAAFAPSPSTGAPPAVNATSPTVEPSTPLAAISAPVLTVEPSNGSRLLVNQTLERYRVAYDDLDARSAQAVWPSVNQAALARAFEALESQTLSFDACDIQVQTKETATATCRGAAQYIPKIGNRDPHTESRVWSFSLRKEGTSWMIDRARVAR
jgi:hypothetical protein